MLNILLSLIAMTLGVLGFTQAGWAQTNDWKMVVEAAKAEGEVIVWGQAGDARRKFWKEAFEKAYPGITVRLFQPQTSSERDTRFLRELESKVAKVDVLVSGSGGMTARLKPAGALQPLKPLLTPDILDGKNWVDGEPVWIDNERQFIIVSDLPVGIAAVANKDVKPGEITTWRDLLDQKWDGKIASLDPRQSGMAFAVALFMQSNPSLGADYVSKLYAKGRVVFSADERQILEWVDSGRMKLAVAIREPEVTALKKVGGSIQVFSTLETGGVQQGIIAGSEGAAAVPNLNPLPHPNAARVYLNWFYSKAGQQAMIDSLGAASTHTEVNQTSVNPITLRVAGAKYTVANDEKINAAELTKAMRDTVTKAVEGR